MKRAVRQILLSTALLLIFCALCRFLLFNEYDLTLPLSRLKPMDCRASDVHMSVDERDVLETGSVRVDGERLRVRLKPHAQGKTFVSFDAPNGESVETFFIRVGAFNTVYNMNTGDFTGDNAVLIACTLFFVAISVIMLRHFRAAKGTELYSYATVYFAGFSIFSIVTAILLGFVTLRHIVDPYTYTMMDAYSVLCGAGAQFMLLTLPLVLLFALAMVISNIALVRHEGFRPKNLLGIFLGLFLLGGEALGIDIFTRNVSGSYEEIKLLEITQNMYATAFVYFECMLAGSAICAIKATRVQPEYDKDYIIILGCAFRKDGTLPPLLRGRVDRAVTFWREQKNRFNKKAVFLPSGGKGSDEVMSEAAAMKRYLLGIGVSEEDILTEDKSATTYQNMLYSKKLIDERNPNARAVFATTNFHLFRSGVFARKVGLNIEGIGSRTRWWYWPNAFVRECASLMASCWKEELVLLALFVGFFTLMAMVVR